MFGMVSKLLGEESAFKILLKDSIRDREEWELCSPKSYYLVDHAMTAHMTGP